MRLFAQKNGEIVRSKAVIVKMGTILSKNVFFWNKYRKISFKKLNDICQS